MTSYLLSAPCQTDMRNGPLLAFLEPRVLASTGGAPGVLVSACEDSSLPSFRYVESLKFEVVPLIAAFCHFIT